MWDTDIRQALIRRLERAYADDQDTLIRQELGVQQGHRRVDLAVINGELVGYEIKSDRDTLARLADQADAYGAVLDRLWLVTTDRYLERAKVILPRWWGLMVAAEKHPSPSAQHSRGDVVLRVVRRPRLNRQQDPMSVAQLLWREEALEVLRGRKLHRGLSKKARWYVWERLADSLDLVELRAVVRDRLRARREWPTVR